MFSVSSAPRTVAASAIVAAALLASGCGGKSAAQRGDCNARIINEALANVVIRAYEAGKVGTRAQVERSLGKGFFTADGHLRPYSSLKSDGMIGQFNHWMHHDPRVLAATLKQQNATSLSIGPRLKRECG